MEITYVNPKKKGKYKLVKRALNIVITVALTTSLGYLGFNIMDKIKNNNLNNEIKSAVVNDNAYTAPAQVVNEETGEVAEVTQSYDDIDFSALKQINPDAVGYLSWSGVDKNGQPTEYNYPVAQTTDDEKYLHTGFDGSQNSCGSIFVSTYSNADLSGKVTMIFGHDMADYSMFGSLNEYKNQAYMDAHPTIEYQTEDAIYRLDVVSITDMNVLNLYNSVVNSKYDTGDSVQDSAQMLADMGQIQNAAAASSGIQLSADDQIVLLVTCNGQGGDERDVTITKATKVLDKTMVNQAGMQR